MNRDVIELARQFPEALAAGLLVSAVCSMLGVFVILKRVVFIGIALSEAAVFGLAAAHQFGWPSFAGAAGFTMGTVGLLAYPFETRRLPRDAALGILFVAAAAGSLLLVSHSGVGLAEIKSILYGDLILADRRDLALLAATLVPVGVGMFLFLRPTLNTFLDREAAKVLGVRTALWDTLFFLALGLAVSAASKIAGALLVFGYLVVAPSAAMLLSRRIGVVLALAALAGVASTLAGLWLSFRYDLPTNQTICLAGCGIFSICAMYRWAREKLT